jgi:hypothetical protein
MSKLTFPESFSFHPPMAKLSTENLSALFSSFKSQFLLLYLGVKSLSYHSWPI